MRKGKCPEYEFDFSRIFGKCERFNEKKFECNKDSDCAKPNQKCCQDPCYLLTCQGKLI